MESQIASNTLQHFEYTMVGEDGDVIYPDEVEITYTVSDPSIVEIDEENHTLTAMENGDVTITVTVGDFTKTLSYTVADVGENKIAEATASFNDLSNWANICTADDGFVQHQVVSEDGNNVLGMTLTGRSIAETKEKGLSK